MKTGGVIVASSVASRFVSIFSSRFSLKSADSIFRRVGGAKGEQPFERNILAPPFLPTCLIWNGLDTLVPTGSYFLFLTSSSHHPTRRHNKNLANCNGSKESASEHFLNLYGFVCFVAV